MFEYTDKWEDVNSSLVRDVYFNNKDNRMLVRLTGDKQYIYNATKDWAESIALNGSPGSEYNYFRRFVSADRGTPAHNEIVAPVDNAYEPQTVNNFVSVSAGDTVEVPRYFASAGKGTANNSYGSIEEASTTPFTFEDAANNYDVSYEVFGTDYTVTVQAGNDVSAVREVENRLKSLSLQGRVKRVTRNL